MSPAKQDLHIQPYTAAEYRIDAGDLVLFRRRPWGWNPRHWVAAASHSLIAWAGRSDYCHAGRVVHLPHGGYLVAEAVEGPGLVVGFALGLLASLSVGLSGWWVALATFLAGVVGMAAAPGSVRLYPLAKYAKSHARLIDVFRPNFPNYNRLGAIENTLSAVGQPYGMLAIVNSAINHLPLVRPLATAVLDALGGVEWLAPLVRRLKAAAGRPYCSALVSQADEIGGGYDPVPELDCHHTEPGDLARSEYGRNYVLTIGG